MPSKSQRSNNRPLRIFVYEMDFNGLRLEYVLEGSLNYISWKDGMEEVLEDNGLKEFIDKDVPKPYAADTANLDAWTKESGKGKEDPIGGSTRPHCLKHPWESHTICNVEDFD
jgi:hypothetical protein